MLITLSTFLSTLNSSWLQLLFPLSRLSRVSPNRTQYQSAYSQTFPIASCKVVLHLTLQHSFLKPHSSQNNALPPVSVYSTYPNLVTLKLLISLTNRTHPEDMGNCGSTYTLQQCNIKINEPTDADPGVIGIGVR